MNETFGKILTTAYGAAVRAGGAAVNVASAVGRKTGELADSAKLRFRAATLEGRVEGCFAEIGEMLYATHTGTPTESDALLSKLQEIDALRAEIRALERETACLQGGVTCPHCGSPVKSSDVFCGACGGKL